MRGKLVLLLTVLALACTNNSGPDITSPPKQANDAQAQLDRPPQEDIMQPTPEPTEPIAPKADVTVSDVPVEPRWYDPIPVESAAASGAESPAEDAPSAPLQVVPLPAGTDPFEKLPSPVVPKLAAGDPLADTLRLGPEPPPEVGSVESRFPPEVVKETPPAVKTPPMTVVRHYPDGQVDLIDRISVTFSHPMVPLADLARLAEMPSPLSITPKVAGTFVWLGTDTVAFQPEGRLPFGNKYSATVSAGTKSALGGALAEA